MVKQDAPHCHAPIHPPAPTPTPTPHPALPLSIMPPCSTNVKINKKGAARQTDKSKPCMLPSCVPAGPGMIVKASMTVKVNMLCAAREGDLTSHPACVAPIPSPVGKVIAPCSTNVVFGG
ncbi:MAG: PAAR domain-containing protein [Candidatus Eisenbacteria bacterium]|uniref:PAAR domain-containing protein n=1 Tax=Eiseniibacteriota bacterium TaxID=2212470 RepID=A0A956N995_UNCEI|nr:PAAR domain-containing protein [Candidatus Eisenbacteria bacterium]MCB9464388.1 PAAR domain-containing protein [Candidatus Eisenbacteria bacterium]